MLKYAQIFMVCSLLLLSPLMAYAEEVVVKKETGEYLLDIKYPQDLYSSAANNVIKDWVKATRAQFMSELIEDAGIPDDVPGKTSLTIRYSIPYYQNKALSVRLDSSVFHRGAAHPSHAVATFNFVDGRAVQLDNLFLAKKDYLSTIAKVCSQAITAKNISEAKWISEGTAPTAENYRSWYFTKEGIMVVFSTYQVAAYVYGDQTVSVPLSVLASMIKPEASKMIWGK